MERHHLRPLLPRYQQLGQRADRSGGVRHDDISDLTVTSAPLTALIVDVYPLAYDSIADLTPQADFDVDTVLQHTLQSRQTMLTICQLFNDAMSTLGMVHIGL